MICALVVCYLIKKNDEYVVVFLHLSLSLSLSLSQSAMEIVNKELCPLFYMPTTSGEWQKMKNTVSEHHVVSSSL